MCKPYRRRLAILAASAVLLAGCATSDPAAPRHTKEDDADPITLSIHRARATAADGYEPEVYEGAVEVFVEPRPYVTEADVWRARTFVGERGALVDLELTAPGTVALARLTRGHVGELLAVYIDGRLVMLSRVQRPLEGGRVLLSGDFSAARAERIAAGLNAQRAARSPLRDRERR